MSKIAVGHGLMLEFDRNDRQFAMGFECGRIWAILSATDDEFDCEMHAENAEMIVRLAEETERTARSEDLGNGWLTVWFSERGVAYQEREPS